MLKCKNRIKGGSKKDLFNTVPRHQTGQLYPSVPCRQMPAEGHPEFLDHQLIQILFPVHLNTPKSCLFRENPLFCKLLLRHILPDSGAFSACFRDKYSKNLIAVNCFVFFSRAYIKTTIAVPRNNKSKKIPNETTLLHIFY